MTRFLTTLNRLAVTAAGAAVLASTTAAAADVRWKMPIAFPSNLPALGKAAGYLADSVKEASDGEVRIRVYEPNKLVPPFEILKAVSDGKVEAGFTWIGYDAGTVPATNLFAAVPFGLKPWAFNAWYYFGGGEAMIQEIYANKGYKVHAELCGIIGPETAGWYRQPVNGLEDLKGLKIRFAGLGGKVLEKLGASVTMLPGGELFQALEKGTIDATEFSAPVIDQFLGFDKVVKYNVFPGWHQTFTTTFLLVNQDVWEQTPKSTRSLIHTACTATTTLALAEGEYLNGKVFAGFEDKGVTAQQLPREALVRLKEISGQVLAEEAAKDADFKRVLESQRAFAETYENWDRRAYVPSDL